MSDQGFPKGQFTLFTLPLTLPLFAQDAQDKGMSLASVSEAAQ